MEDPVTQPQYQYYPTYHHAAFQPPPGPARVRLDSGANKSTGVAYALWFFLGIFGAHRFYLRHPGSGILYLCTFGMFMIGWLVDAFTIPTMVRRVNVIGY
jgi:hypothetical protein